MKFGKYIEWILVSIVCIVLALFISGSDFQSLNYHSTTEDIYQVYWNTQYFASRVMHGLNPYVNVVFLFPDKTSLAMHSYTPVFGLVNSIFNDPVLSIKLVIVFNFWSLALGLYVLSGMWLKHPLLKMAVAFIGVFNGYLLAKSGLHYNLILVGMVPWNIYFLMRAFTSDKPRIQSNKYLVLGIVFLGINYFFDFYTVFATFIFCGTWFLYQWFLAKWFASFTIKKAIVIFIVLLFFHFMYRFMFLHGMDHRGGIWESADLHHLLIPNEAGRYFSSSEKYINSPVTENFVFLGYTVFALLISGLILFIRKGNTIKDAGSFLFLICILFGIIFPSMKWNGIPVFFSPTAGIHFMPFLDNLRAPSRFFEWWIIAISLFVFIVMERSQIPLLKRKYVLTFIAIIFITGSYFDHAVVPMKKLTSGSLAVKSEDTSAFKDKVVLTIPFGIRDGIKGLGEFNNDDYLLAGTPGIKLVSGYFSRIPEKTWKRIEADSFYQYIAQLQKDTGEIITDFPEDPSELKTKIKFFEFVKWMDGHHITHLRVDWSKVKKNSAFTELFGILAYYAYISGKNEADGSISRCYRVQ